MINQETNQRLKTQPRFFYGYIVVIAAFFAMMVSFGLFGTSFGIFFKPLLAEFGWTRAMISGAYSLSGILLGALGVIMGRLTDRFGPRPILTFCGIFLGLGYLLMSQTSTLWQLYLFYGVIVGIGMSGIWVPLLSTVARWFIGRRSLMTGIVIAGMGLGSFITPPVISQLISAYGWRLSYIVMGCTILLIMVLAAQFLRYGPTQKGQLPYGENEGPQQELKSATKDFFLKEAVYTIQFWLIAIISLCSGFSLLTIVIHIVPHATDLGVSAVSAANILATMGGIRILGNYVLGSLADRIGNGQIIIISFILMLASLFWLMPAREVWMLHLFVGVFGFAHGGISASESPLVARLFGLHSHGLIYGVIAVGFTVGATIGPFVAGYIFDTTGSYQLAFLLCAAFAIIGLISAAILRLPERLDVKI